MMNFNQALLSENMQSDKVDSVAHTILDNERSNERESREELQQPVFSMKTEKSQKMGTSMASRRPPAHRPANADPRNININTLLEKPFSSQVSLRPRPSVQQEESNSPNRSIA